jgi:NTE family protein
MNFSSFAEEVRIDTTENGNRPKIGLVLSGGGARGFAHIGALKVLEEVGIRPDYITGTSMGSIIGALYSIGYTADELDSLSRSLDWDLLFTDEVDHRLLSIQDKIWDGRFFLNFPASQKEGIQLPKGLIAGQQISILLTDLFWPYLNVHDFNQLPIPFGCVAMDLETGEAVFVQNGFLTDAIRSSISIPTIFTPNLDLLTNQVLVDGGWARNLPVTDAIGMGADIIIAIDVTTDLYKRDKIKSLLDVFEQTSKYRILEVNEFERSHADIIIEPTAKFFGGQDFNQIDTLISSGVYAAKDKLDELRKLSTSQNNFTSEINSSSINKKKIKPIYITRITTNSVNSDKDLTSYDKIFNRYTNKLIYPEDIAELVNTLYAKGDFTSIKHLIYPDEKSDINGFQIHLQVEERTKGEFRVGLRYDDETQAAILLQANLNNVLADRTTLSATARLGNDNLFQLQHTQLNSNEWLGYQISTEYRSRSFSTFENGTRTSDYRLNQFTSTAQIGSLIRNKLLLSAGLRFDAFDVTDPLNYDLLKLPANGEILSIQSVLFYDNLDRIWFPKYGQRFILQFNASNEYLYNPSAYSNIRFNHTSRNTIKRLWTIGSDFYAIRTTGNNLPPMFYAFAPTEQVGLNLDYVFFYGKKRHNLDGRNLIILNLLSQFNLSRKTNISLHYSIGNSIDNFDTDLLGNSFRDGYAVSYGTQTLLGPIQMIFGFEKNNEITWSLRVGYPF